ncbi:glycosyltransferase family 4 protein [Tunturiibacter gelidiferens]|uniref:glycosyltransferase family 4 protein n=1 Tax=Tunturiibacter gelidiferens TaxID=3069689 RepID=UPI003D9B2B7E
MLTKALPYSPLHRRWIGKMSTVLAANEDTLRLIKKMGRSDVRLQFDNGVGTDYLAKGPRRFKPDAGAVRLVWVGRILPRKALPMALDALAKVRHDWMLTIVGNGLAETTVRQMIAERGLSERVHWAGRRLTWEEVRAAYLEHDALLFTSLRETSGVQLLEAMALGLPVITLDLHGARDVVPEEAGIKVPVTTPAEVVCGLAAAIDRFASLSVDKKMRCLVRAGSSPEPTPGPRGRLRLSFCTGSLWGGNVKAKSGEIDASERNNDATIPGSSDGRVLWSLGLLHYLPGGPR